MTLLMYLETIKKNVSEGDVLTDSPRREVILVSSDLKFKNTALMLNASIFIRKELDSLCGHNIGSNNISTYKYSNQNQTWTINLYM